MSPALRMMRSIGDFFSRIRKLVHQSFPVSNTQNVSMEVQTSVFIEQLFAELGGWMIPHPCGNPGFTEKLAHMKTSFKSPCSSAAGIIALTLLIWLTFFDAQMIPSVIAMMPMIMLTIRITSEYFHILITSNTSTGNMVPLRGLNQFLSIFHERTRLPPANTAIVMTNSQILPPYTENVAIYFV